MSNRKGTRTVSPTERARIWQRELRTYGIPGHYLEALSKGESNWTANAVTGSYVGLLQVGPEVLEGYNKANGTAWTLNARLDPELNATFCAWQLRVIIGAYNASHIKELKEDWSSLEWQAILTAGWNSGYSKRAGVLKVAEYLHGAGLPVTHQRLFTYSQVAGGTKHLQNAKKRRWQRAVALRSFRVKEKGGRGSTAPTCSHQ